MDLLTLITAYGKQGDFDSAERILGYVKKKSYPPSVISHTALMETYGMGERYKNAEAIFRRMQSSGARAFCFDSNQFKEAEEVFETQLDSEKSPLNPDRKMFQMMIYMHKKTGSYEKACRVFSLMAERGAEQSTVTYNSLMSSETNYKEMQRAGLRPDVVSFALLVNAYGKAGREAEALAVFEEMLSAGVRCTPDLCSYTTMLSAYVNASDMDGAEKFFRRLKQDGLSPNEVTCRALIKGYAKQTIWGR